MHIILTVNFSPWSPYSGGAQHSTHELAAAFSWLGHSVDVVYTKTPWESLDVPKKVPYNIHYAHFVGRRSRRDAPLRYLNAVTVAVEVARLLGKRPSPGHTVVHSQGEEGALLPKLRTHLRFKFVMTPRYPSFPPQMLESRLDVLSRLRLSVLDFKYIALGSALLGADRFCPT